MPPILKALRDYLADAAPGGSLNPELTGDVNKSSVPHAVTAIRALFGEAPDKLGISVLHPQRDELKDLADKAFWLGTASQVSPVAGGLSSLARNTRTGRNIGRVIIGTNPLEAALQEISRVEVPFERAAASSKRGWVGPVQVGDMTGVDIPRSSRLRRATSVTHTHPRQGEFGGYAPMSPGDRGVLEGRPVDMNVVHTNYNTGAPTKYRESMTAGALPPQPSSEMPVKEYLDRLMDTDGYTTNVPRWLRDEWGTVNPSDYATPGLQTLRTDEAEELMRRGAEKIRPSYRWDKLYSQLSDSHNILQDVVDTADEMGRKVTLLGKPKIGQVSDAMGQDYFIPGYRFVPGDDLAARHPEAYALGSHFAPLGQEQQIFDIMRKYIGDSSTQMWPDAKIGFVMAKPKNVALVSDEMAEYPDVFAKEFGVFDAWRRSAGKTPQQQRLTAEALARKMGVDSLLYENKMEGLGDLMVKPSFGIEGMENPSMTVLRRGNLKGNFARGGLAQFKECVCQK